MSVRPRKLLHELSLEDYIAVKQYAYDFVKKTEHLDVAKIYAQEHNVLGYRGDEAEAILFFTTAAFPYDDDFCSYYFEHHGDLKAEELEEIFLIPDFQMLEMKRGEIELFHLDKLLEDGTLIPPDRKNMENLASFKENYKKH